MAKDQQLALNPAKISGNCGRLLCCLRYEEEAYTMALRQFPPVGATVRVDGKQGSVSFINVFELRAQVHFEDKSAEWYTADEIRKGKKADAPQQPQQE